MPAPKENPQLKYSNIDLEKGRDPEGTYYTNHLIPWARTVSKKGLLLDIGAGLGVEAAAMSRFHPRVIAFDGSEDMARNSIFRADYRIARCSNLNLPSGTASGIHSKEMIIFLNPKERKAFFEECARVLSSNGKILFQTKTSQNLKVFGGHIRGKRLDGRPIFSTAKYDVIHPDNSNWRDKIRQADTTDRQIFSIEFRTTADELCAQLKEAGFRILRLIEYDHNSALAKENRWVRAGGVIISACLQ